MFNKQSKNLKKVFVLVSVATLGFFSAGGVYAESASIEVPASVQVNTALVIVSGYPLSFGTATVNNSAGSVTMATSSDTVTNSGGVTSVDTAASNRGLVSFLAPNDTDGTTNYGVTIDTFVDLTDSVSGNALTLLPSVDVIGFTPTGPGEIIEIHIGGTITFGASTLAGAYQGSITLTVEST